MVSEAARQSLRDHLAGELAGDLDATMAPLSEHPVWLIQNYRLEGQEAVRAMYSKALPLTPAEYLEEILRAVEVEVSARVAVVADGILWPAPDA